MIITSLFLFMLMTSQAYAYLDPGTGGFIIQAILGFVAAIFAYVTFFWNKIKSFFNKIFKGKNNEIQKNDSEE